MKAGGRYFFQIKINNGSLMKIGVCRSHIPFELVIIFVRLIEYLGLFGHPLRLGDLQRGTEAQQ